MKTSVKNTINQLLGLVGLKVSRNRNDEPHQIVRGLLKNNIDVVLDVGSNTGQFARSIRAAGYRNKIVCFEPLPDAHEKLRNRLAGDEEVIIHPRVALGDKQGSIRINVSGNSVSSSILNLLPSHANAAPESNYIDTVETEIECLDTVFSDYVKPRDRAFLKIDTQGYEWNVLDGAKISLDSIEGLLLEMSLIPLYEGQRLWKDILHRLEEEGLILWQIIPGFSDPESGRSLQFDGVFYRDPARS
jgi:FkbM family methyltransferase